MPKDLHVIILIKKFYNVHRKSDSTWLVLNKEAGTISPENGSAAKIKFDRVIIISKRVLLGLNYLWE